jgi:hypothetical protein
MPVTVVNPMVMERSRIFIITSKNVKQMHADINAVTLTEISHPLLSLTPGATGRIVVKGVRPRFSQPSDFGF